MNKISLSLFTLTTALAANLPTQAAVLNGGFETGDFTNWTTGGDVIVQNTIFGDSTAVAPEGNYVALLSNSSVLGGEVISDVTALETSAGLLAGSLTNRNALNGSFVAQTFSANAGDTISFNWNFFTNEFTNSDINTNDFAFFSIIPNFETLADVNTSTFTTASASSFFSATTGFQAVTQALPTDGTYSFVAGIVGVGDTQAESGLAIDSFAVTKSPSTPVPEPSSMLGLGGLAVAFTALRFKHTQSRVKKSFN